ncbi:MAG: hypothetical protein J6Y91_04530 [Alphaproteobacteria bacterium]|nr:hypothetical protein [Alphaproteobacteria bacterium]
MAEEKKQTLGQKFLAALEHAKENKAQLLQVAGAVIRTLPQEGKLAEKNLPDTIGGIIVPAAAARINILNNRVVSSDAMIMMVMKEYHDHGFGSPEKFKSDFKKAFPEEYGNGNEKKSNPLMMMRASARRQAQL